MVRGWSTLNGITNHTVLLLNSTKDGSVLPVFLSETSFVAGSDKDGRDYICDSVVGWTEEAVISALDDLQRMEKEILQQ